MNTALKKIAAVAILAIISMAFKPLLRPQQGSRNNLTTRLISVSPMVFIETTSQGKKIEHQILHAKIEVSGQAQEGALRKFADNIFASRLRSDADVRSRDMVWITFYFGEQSHQNSGMVRTYREIYAKTEQDWRNLADEKRV
ncbi:hypothetical protein [Methylorubrum aminovorans]